MKNQYFGDVNDYRKYGLLRCIFKAGDFKPLIAWMLTSDDRSADGKFITYLQKPEKWRKHDPELFDILKSRIEQGRHVRHVENSNLLSNAGYFSKKVTDALIERQKWFSDLKVLAQDKDFVFLDPDNGMEVKSTRCGRKKSSKFLYDYEVKELWSLGKSLLIYQHFAMIKRDVFIQQKLEQLQQQAPDSMLSAFKTPHVVFLMALQSWHYRFRNAIVRSVQENWHGQIRHWD